MGDCYTCYDLENSTIKEEAIEALTNLGDETYFYRVMAFLGNVQVAPIYDFFSTGKPHCGWYLM